MATRKRQGNRPDRRVWWQAPLDDAGIAALIDRCRYVGASFHKLSPADYGLTPPRAPRPHKSVCDDLRPIFKGEAKALLEAGIRRRMVSFFASNSAPKYIWAVDENGEVFEAKTHPRHKTRYYDYHGYRLGENDASFRRYILETWNSR